MIPVKKCKVFPDNKLGKKTVYFQGDLAEWKEVQRAVKLEIRKARENHIHKIELKFKTCDMRTVWEGIKTMSDMQQNGQNPKCLSSLVFAEDMNFSILMLTDIIVLENYSLNTKKNIPNVQKRSWS